MIARKKKLVLATVILSIGMPLFSIPTVQASSYSFTYHTGPKDQDCHWVYRWKRVYGKRVKVKVRVCK